MKKVLAFILAMLMVVSMLPLELIAKNEDFLSSNEIEVDFGDNVEDDDRIFSEEEQSVSIKRDYHQDAQVGLNINARGEYLFKINNPFDDLYIGFGTESEDVIMTMGYSNSLPFKINAQNAESVNYEIYIEAWDKGILKEKTKVNISIDNNGLNIDMNYHINDKGQVELSITNEGYDTVADLTLNLSSESSKYFSAQKDLSNYYLHPNSSVDAILVPNFEELVKLENKSFTIKFEITGAAQKREFEINYDFSNSTIEKKTVKEILEDMQEDEPSTPEDPENEEKWLRGKYDFPDGVLTFADINEWPEEISIEVDRLQILDNNEYLVKYNLTTFDVELNNQGSEEETLSNSDTYKEINIKLPVQKLIFELTDKDGKTYQRILRVIKPDKEIIIDDSVKMLDSNITNEISESILDDNSEFLDDNRIKIFAIKESYLYNEIISGNISNDDVIFLPDYKDEEKAILQCFLRVLEINDFDGGKELTIEKASFMDLLPPDSMFEAYAKSPADLVEKYTYDPLNGFDIVDNVKTYSSRSTENLISKAYNFGKDLEPIVLKIGDDLELSVDRRAFFEIMVKDNEFIFEGGIFKKKFCKFLLNQIDLQGGIYTFLSVKFKGVELDLNDPNQKLELEQKLLELGDEKSKFSLDLELGLNDKKKAESKEKEKKFGFSGLNYNDKQIVYGLGYNVTTQTPVTFTKNLTYIDPLIIWLLFYIDCDGSLKVSFEYGVVAEDKIDSLIFAAKTRNVGYEYIGIDPGTEPISSYKIDNVLGRAEILVPDSLIPDFLILDTFFVVNHNESYPKAYENKGFKVEGSLDVEVGVITIGIMLGGEMIFDFTPVMAKIELEGKISYCDVDPRYIPIANKYFRKFSNYCSNPGEWCFEASAKFSLSLKARFKIKIKILPWSSGVSVGYEFKHTYLEAKKEFKSENCQNEVLEYEDRALDPKDPNIYKLIKTKDKKENEDPKNKIPTPKKKNNGSTVKPIVENEDNLPSYEIHQQGEQCINARVREWDWSIPLFDKLSMSKNQPMPSIETVSLYTVSENDQNSNTVDLLSTNNKEEYSLFNDSETTNNTSDKVEAYLVSKVTLDDVRKNKFEEFSYFVNGKAVGKESLDLGGHQIYKIKEGILSPGKNIMVQNNSYTNPGSARMQSDTRLIIPLPLDQEIYTYNGKPVLDIAAPYVDFAVDTDSAKFKNAYPGLIDSIHTVDIRVLNVGTKTDYANICLVEEIDGDSRNLDIKRVKISAMDQVIEEFKFYRKPGANYLVEVYDDEGLFDNNPENNSSVIRIEEFDKSKITPEVRLVNSSFRKDQKYALAVYAKSPVGARIKTIIAYNEGKEIARRDLDTISYNDSYDLMKSDSLIKFDKITAIDEYGTIGEKLFTRRKIQVKLPSEANGKYVFGRVDFSWINNRNQDGIINVETSNDETGGLLSYDNRFLGFKSKDDFIDLSNTKFSEMKIVKGPGVKVESISAFFEESDYRYYVDIAELNQDSILFSPGKYDINITYSKDGIYNTVYKLIDTANIEDIKLEAKEDSEYAFVKVNAPNGINYYAYADGINIPKEGIKLSNNFINKGVYVGVNDNNNNRISYRQKIKEGDNIINIRPAVFKLEDDYSVEFNNVTIKCSEISNNDISVNSLEGYLALITDVKTGEKTYARVSYYEGNGNIRIHNRDYKGNLITGKKKVRLIFNAEYEYNEEVDNDYTDPGYRYDPSPDYLNNRDRDDKIVVRQPDRGEKKEEKKEEAKQEDIFKTLYFYLDKSYYEMEVNGSVNQIPMDVAPTAINQRTMLPIRYVAEAIGATVEWHQDTQSATFTKDGITATITLGSNIIQVSDGRQIVMDTEPVVIAERIFVPLTNISQIFGLTNGDLRDGEDNDIEWDQENYRVIIKVKEN